MQSFHFGFRNIQPTEHDENPNLLNEVVAICKQKFEAMKTTEVIRLLDNNLHKFLDK